MPSLRGAPPGPDVIPRPKRAPRPWRCPSAQACSPDRGRPALERACGIPIEGRMPSLRGAPPGPSVVPRPKRAPRTEGVPPSKGLAGFQSRAGCPRSGVPRLVLALSLGPSVLPGARASRPRKGLRDSNRGQDALAPGCPAWSWRCPSAQACSPDRGRPALERACGIPIEGRMPSLRGAPPGPDVVPRPKRAPRPWRCPSAQACSPDRGRPALDLIRARSGPPATRAIGEPLPAVS